MGTIKDAKKGTFWWFNPEDPRIKIITDPAHRLYDRRVKQPPTEALIESIAKEGMKQPISVRKVGGEYQVVFGRKRVEAAREAAKRYPDEKILIKAMPATLTDSEALRDATIENSLRVEDSASVKGFNASRLIESGYEDVELERMFGVKISTIRDWIEFHEKATEEVKSALDRGEITYTDAKKISRKRNQSDALQSALQKEKPRRGPKPGPRTPKISMTAKREDGQVKISTKNLGAFTLDELCDVRDNFRDMIQEEIEKRL